uniref:Protein kinase domain-containing protein n=1 Tax=Timema bartmani TaxID=61472 RepID=A0A7R9EU27_9NEOP|nr:unnamed protein product [Timema bartmani]
MAGELADLTHLIPGMLLGIMAGLLITGRPDSPYTSSDTGYNGWSTGSAIIPVSSYTWRVSGYNGGSTTELSYLTRLIHDVFLEMEPSFPYRDIVIKRGQDVKDLFLLQTEIGRGKFGTVYRCQEHSTGLQLAAKFVSTSRREDRRNVEREIEIMRALQHPRLIQLYDAFDNGKVMVLILEL